MSAGTSCPPEQLRRTQRRALTTIFFFDSMPPSFLMQVFTQELVRLRIQQPDHPAVPLNQNSPPYPSRRRAVVGRLHLHAAIQIHYSPSILIEAERLDRQRNQRRLLFGEHRCNLPLPGPVYSRICPPLFPIVEVSLRLIEAVEALPFERSFLCVTYSGFDLSLSIRIFDSARHRYSH